MPTLHGQPFSACAWQAPIPLYANATASAFRVIDDRQPDHGEVVQRARPAGKLPVLRAGEPGY